MDLEFDSADYDRSNIPNMHVYEIASRAAIISIVSEHNINCKINDVGGSIPAESPHMISDMDCHNGINVDIEADELDYESLINEISRTDLDSHECMATIGKFATILSDTRRTTEVAPFTPECEYL